MTTHSKQHRFWIKAGETKFFTGFTAITVTLNEIIGETHGNEELLIEIMDDENIYHDYYLSSIQCMPLGHPMRSLRTTLGFPFRVSIRGNSQSVYLIQLHGVEERKD